MTARLPRLRPLTSDEVAELQAYAAEFGRKWKADLQAESWWRGIPARGRTRDYPNLYGLRNSHGPSWLASYRLPKG